MKKNKEKRDLKNFMAYVKYQCGHGVPLDDVLKNLGYECPANDWNPDYHGESVVEFCPTCEHWKKDCIIYGKKAMAKAGNWERN